MERKLANPNSFGSIISAKIKKKGKSYELSITDIHSTERHRAKSVAGAHRIFKFWYPKPKADWVGIGGKVVQTETKGTQRESLGVVMSRSEKEDLEWYVRERKISLGAFVRDAIMEKMCRDSDLIYNKIDLDFLLQTVCSVWSVPIEEVRGKSRRQVYVRPRMCYMWFAAYQTDYDLKEIGQEIGGRDHSTVIHGRDTWDSYVSEYFRSFPISRNVYLQNQQQIKDIIKDNLKKEKHENT